MGSDKPEFESMEQVAAYTAARLDEAANAHAFRLFNDKRFRNLAGFDKLDEEEQNRIFNELVVSNLVLIMLSLEAPDLRVENDLKPYLRELKDRMPAAHICSLRALGIEPEHLDIWEKLIAMRYEEYAGDRHKVRAEAMHLESSEKDLDCEGLARVQLLVPVETVGIGCFDHICRGKMEGRDELLKLIVKATMKFYSEFRLALEVGEVTPLMRARARLRRFLH